MSDFSKKHVLIIVENLPVPFDRRVWLEATTLVAFGAAVTVICPATPKFPAGKFIVAGVTVYRHPMPAEGKGFKSYVIEYVAALFWQTLLSWRIFFNHRFNAIHACNPPDLIWIVALPFKLLGVRFVFDHHDINPELFEAKFRRRGFFWHCLRWMERMSFRLADISIATNESYKKIAMERGGMKGENVFVVRSGPDLARVKRRGINVSWRSGKTHMVAYVGVIGEQEGLDLLVEAVDILNRRVGSQGLDCHFVVVGDGPVASDVRLMAKQLEVDQYFTFTGRVDDEVLFEVLETADICVNPDRVNEMNDKSTMNKIMEYMAFGKPIVQFDVTEGRYSAGGASLYAKANDASDFASKIHELLGDEALRSQMGALGYARLVDELAWDSQVETLRSAYVRALKVGVTP